MVLDRPAGADARIVDQHVEAPQALGVSPCERHHVVLLSHVRLHGQDVDALAAELLGGLLELFRPACRDRDGVAFAPQRTRDLETDPARAAGDKGRALGH